MSRSEFRSPSDCPEHPMDYPIPPYSADGIGFPYISGATVFRTTVRRIPEIVVNRAFSTINECLLSKKGLLRRDDLMEWRSHLGEAHYASWERLLVDGDDFLFFSDVQEDSRPSLPRLFPRNFRELLDADLIPFCQNLVQIVVQHIRAVLIDPLPKHHTSKTPSPMDDLTYARAMCLLVHLVLVFRLRRLFTDNTPLLSTLGWMISKVGFIPRGCSANGIAKKASSLQDWLFLLRNLAMVEEPFTSSFFAENTQVFKNVLLWAELDLGSFVSAVRRTGGDETNAQSNVRFAGTCVGLALQIASYGVARRTLIDESVEHVLVGCFKDLRRVWREVTGRSLSVSNWMERTIIPLLKCPEVLFTEKCTDDWVAWTVVRMIQIRQGNLRDRFSKEMCAGNGEFFRELWGRCRVWFAKWKEIDSRGGELNLEELCTTDLITREICMYFVLQATSRIQAWFSDDGTGDAMVAALGRDQVIQDLMEFLTKASNGPDTPFTRAFASNILSILSCVCSESSEDTERMALLQSPEFVLCFRRGSRLVTFFDACEYHHVLRCFHWILYRSVDVGIAFLEAHSRDVLRFFSTAFSFVMTEHRHGIIDMLPDLLVLRSVYQLYGMVVLYSQECGAGMRTLKKLLKVHLFRGKKPFLTRLVLGMARLPEISRFRVFFLLDTLLEVMPETIRPHLVIPLGSSVGSIESIMFSFIRKLPALHSEHPEVESELWQVVVFWALHGKFAESVPLSAQADCDAVFEDLKQCQRNTLSVEFLIARTRRITSVPDEPPFHDVFYSCSFCSKAARMKCSRCKTARYCDAVCQKRHWKKHKLVCQQTHL